MGHVLPVEFLQPITWNTRKDITRRVATVAMGNNKKFLVEKKRKPKSSLKKRKKKKNQWEKRKCWTIPCWTWANPWWSGPPGVSLSTMTRCLRETSPCQSTDCVTPGTNPSKVSHRWLGPLFLLPVLPLIVITTNGEKKKKRNEKVDESIRLWGSFLPWSWLRRKIAERKTDGIDIKGKVG